MKERPILRAALFGLLLVAAFWLTRQLPLLLWGTESSDAIDLRFRFTEWATFRAAQPVYALHPSAVYPPASYMMMSPLLAWQSFITVRWLWGIISMIGLIMLAWLVMRGSQAQGWLEKSVIFAIPFALHATGVTFATGQVVLIVMPLAIGGVLLTQERERWKQAVGAGFFLFALIKPTVTAPFFLLILLMPNTLFPAVLIVSGYLLLTLSSTVWQSENVVTLMLNWFVRAGAGAQHGAESGGYGNQQSWLDAWHQAHYFITIFSLTALAAWVRWRRYWDVWTVLGVAALVARLYVYHRSYDDLLLLIPIIAIWRLRKEQPLANWLLLLSVPPLLLPVRMPFSADLLEPIGIIYRTVSWLIILTFLMSQARGRARALPSESQPRLKSTQTVHP